MNVLQLRPKVKRNITKKERYCRNQKFLKLLPNPNPTTDIEPSKVIPRNTNEHIVKPGVP
jgi:hypothetical protein